MVENENFSWDPYEEIYDRFRLNSPRYLRIIDYHVNSLSDKKRIIDTGCGTGNLSQKLLENGKDVVAVDSSESGLRIALQKCKKYNGEGKSRFDAFNMNVENMNFPNGSFDGAVSMFVIPFVSNLKNYFSEIFRILEDGGKFSFSYWVPNEDSYKRIIEDLGGHFREKGIFVEEEWKEFDKYNRKLLPCVLNGPSVERVIDLLSGIGFQSFCFLEEQPYEESAYSCTCAKF